MKIKCLKLNFDNIHSIEPCLNLQADLFKISLLITSLFKLKYNKSIKFYMKKRKTTVRQYRRRDGTRVQSHKRSITKRSTKSRSGTRRDTTPIRITNSKSSRNYSIPLNNPSPKFIEPFLSNRALSEAIMKDIESVWNPRNKVDIPEELIIDLINSAGEGQITNELIKSYIRKYLPILAADITNLPIENITRYFLIMELTHFNQFILLFTILQHNHSQLPLQNPSHCIQSSDTIHTTKDNKI
jgi:hypothetical protein